MTISIRPRIPNSWDSPINVFLRYVSLHDWGFELDQRRISGQSLVLTMQVNCKNQKMDKVEFPYSFVFFNMFATTSGHVRLMLAPNVQVLLKDVVGASHASGGAFR